MENSKLVIINGPLKGREFVLSDSEMIVGRLEKCDILIPFDVVSRRHAQVSFSNDKYFIKDLGSHNGTIINGKPVQLHELRSGDIINISDTELKFVAPNISSAQSESKNHADKRNEKTGVIDMQEVVQAIGGKASASMAVHKSGEPSMSSVVEDPLINKVVGAYRVLELIGSGGMGRVYRGKHTKLEKTVALKVLSPELITNRDFVQRFYREARMAATLEHPNIVSVFDVGEDQGCHYLIMQYVDGISLSGYIQQKGRIDLVDAVDIMEKIARGLYCAEVNNIVHRDIKPGNVLLTKDGGVKIVDFGLSKNVAGMTMLTQAGILMGTPHYMAPEQCVEGVVDHRADIYSLGATGFYMLTGHKPFSSLKALEVIRMKKRGKIPPLEDMGPEVSEEITVIISKMMATKPEDRYQSNSDIIADLTKSSLKKT